MDSSSQLAVISILHLCDGSVNTPLFQKPLEERLAPAPALTSIQLFFRSPPSSLPPVSPSQLSDFSSHTPAFTPQSLCQALCLFQWYLASENIKKNHFIAAGVVLVESLRTCLLFSITISVLLVYCRLAKYP